MSRSMNDASTQHVKGFTPCHCPFKNSDQIIDFEFTGCVGVSCRFFAACDHEHKTPPENPTKTLLIALPAMNGQLLYTLVGK